MSYLQIPNNKSRLLANITPTLAVIAATICGYTVRFFMLGCIIAFVMGAGFPIMLWFYTAGLNISWFLGGY